MTSPPFDPLLGVAVNLLAEMITDCTEAPPGKPARAPPRSGMVVMHDERLRTKYVFFGEATGLQSHRYAVRHLVRVLPLLCTETATLARAEPLLKFLLAYEHHVPILADAPGKPGLDRFTTGRDHVLDGVPSSITLPVPAAAASEESEDHLEPPEDLYQAVFFQEEVSCLMPLFQWRKAAAKSHFKDPFVMRDLGSALKLQLQETALQTLTKSPSRDLMSIILSKYETWAGVPKNAPWAVRFFVVSMMLHLKSVDTFTHDAKPSSRCVPCLNNQCRRCVVPLHAVGTKRHARLPGNTTYQCQPLPMFRVSLEKRPQRTLSDVICGMKLFIDRHDDSDSDSDDDEDYVRNTGTESDYKSLAEEYPSLMGRPPPCRLLPRTDGAEAVVKETTCYWINMLGLRRFGTPISSLHDTTSEGSLCLPATLRAIVMGDPERSKGCCSEACADQWERAYQRHERLLQTHDFFIPTPEQLLGVCGRRRLPSARVLFEEAIDFNNVLQCRMRARDAARAASSGTPVHADPHELDLHIICMRNTHTLLMYAASLVADTSVNKIGTRRKFVPGSFASSSAPDGAYESLHSFASNYQLYGRAVQSIWRIFGFSKGCVHSDLSIATTLITTKVPDAGSPCSGLFEKVKGNALEIF